MLKKILLLSGMGLTLAMLWFAISSYQAAFPIAEENLRGLALSTTAAVETIVNQDPSFASLKVLRPKDLAFMALVDDTGTYTFHSNPDMIGTKTVDSRYLDVLRKREPVDGRIPLGTGEIAYAFFSPIHISGNAQCLGLTLHTFGADAVIRSARVALTVLLSLLAGGWVLAFIVYRFARREEALRLEMARQESLARLGEMGAILAHEIRNPLAGIKGFAQVISSKPMDERNSGFAQRIVGETIRLENLVNDLLAYAGTGVIRPGLFRLEELIEHLVAMVRQEADQQNIAISVVCPEDLQLHADRDRIGQVLLNLFKNAMQAMPDGGGIVIGVEQSDNDVVVVVTDTGSGIPPAKLEKIFQPFFTTNAKGTGLGLALCKKIIDAHHGKIMVQSTPDKGTTMTIRLPGRQQAGRVEL